jgi:hypothetical protein
MLRKSSVYPAATERKNPTGPDRMMPTTIPSARLNSPDAKVSQRVINNPRNNRSQSEAASPNIDGGWKMEE